jgi:hypothetical protein
MHSGRARTSIRLGLIPVGIAQWGFRMRRPHTTSTCSAMAVLSKYLRTTRPTHRAAEEIQMHLAYIVSMFRSNDFDIPMLIHDKVPPGVDVMKQKRNAISYAYEPTKLGGLVRIKTADPEALKAIHQFLLFQIKDHRTGDPVTVG